MTATTCRQKLGWLAWWPRSDRPIPSTIEWTCLPLKHHLFTLFHDHWIPFIRLHGRLMVDLLTMQLRSLSTSDSLSETLGRYGCCPIMASWEILRAGQLNQYLAFTAYADHSAIAEHRPNVRQCRYHFLVQWHWLCHALIMHWLNTDVLIHYNRSGGSHICYLCCLAVGGNYKRLLRS